MNKVNRLILESLNKLDVDEADKLYEELANSGEFLAKDRVDDTIMFIFPDGRLIGEPDIEELIKSGEDLDQLPNGGHVYHAHLNKYVSNKYLTRNLYTHPMNNAQLNTYYNLIVVVPGGISQIYLPPETVPTFEQLVVLRQFRDMGYTINDENYFHWEDMTDEEYYRKLEDWGLR